MFPWIDTADFAVDLWVMQKSNYLSGTTFSGSTIFRSCYLISLFQWSTSWHPKEGRALYYTRWENCEYYSEKPKEIQTPKQYKQQYKKRKHEFKVFPSWEKLPKFCDKIQHNWSITDAKLISKIKNGVTHVYGENYIYDIFYFITKNLAQIFFSGFL